MVNPADIPRPAKLSVVKTDKIDALNIAKQLQAGNLNKLAIRNLKVKLKVSECFKTGQHAFCTLRSVFDTLRKRGLEPYNFILNILTT